MKRRHPPRTVGPPGSRGVLLHAIFALSGLASLGYEVVWTRMFSFGLGHEVAGMLAVVTAFFSGLALGSWMLDRRVSGSAVPGRWYAGLEFAIGGWALLSILFVPVLSELATKLIGLHPSPARHWGVAFGVPFLALLPATAAMGATFPAMERVTSRQGPKHVVAGLYAANTIGAAAGVLLVTFVVAPRLGFRASLVALAALSFACAVGILIGRARGEADRPPARTSIRDAPGRKRLAATLLLTGLLGIGYETIAVRVMGQVLENTVYSFSAALAVYLVGTSVGAALYQRLARKDDFHRPLTRLLAALAVACVLGVTILSWSSPLYEWIRAGLGGGFSGSVAAEMGLALLVFLLPTSLMGATFSHLAQASRRAGGGVGRALAVNTLGAALAPLTFGVLLLPAIGARGAMLAIGGGYLALAPRPRNREFAILAAGVVTLAVATPDLVLVEPPPEGRILTYREGVMAAVSVTDVHGHRELRVNNRFAMGGSLGLFGERRQAHLPLLFHPDPRSVLFLGVGTGITAGAATVHSGLSVEAVELVPEVVDCLPYFAIENRPAGAPGEVHYEIADARRYVRASDRQYDVIIADLFHPSRDGAGALYTTDHFRAIADRLAEGGLFCQWLPLHQINLETTRTIVRTFVHVFPDAQANLAHFNVSTPALGLIASTSLPPPSPTWFTERLRGRGIGAALLEVALTDAFALFGTTLAGPEELSTFAGAGLLSTDDRPIVLFEAPRFTYAADEPPHDRLLTLVDLWSGFTDRAPMEPNLGPFLARLERYRSARDLFLHGAAAQALGRTDEALDTMLRSAQSSADFRTAYENCVLLLETETIDAARVRRVLLALREIHPDDARVATYLARVKGE